MGSTPALVALLVGAWTSQLDDGDALNVPVAAERETSLDDLEASYDSVFRPLPMLPASPAFLTIDLLRRAVPRRARSGLSDPGTIEGTWLGEEQKVFIAFYRWGAVESSLVVVDSNGRLRDSAVFIRARVMLADVCGDDRSEILVKTIEGNAVSVYPSRWRIFALTEDHHLKEIANVAAAYAFGSKRVAYCFFNHLTFPSKNTMVIDAVHVDRTCIASQPWPRQSPRKVGERRLFRYDPASHRFVERAVEAAASRP